MNDEMQLAMWNVIKSLAGVVVAQQNASAVVKERLDSLNFALQKQFGWEAPEPPPEPSAEELEALKRGVAELEKMIGGDVQP